MMNVKFNLHTHTSYCDGSKDIEEMIKAAINYNYQIIGISSHGPLPFESDWTMKKEDLHEYIEEVKKLKEKYKSDIKILLGLELDYIPGFKFDYIDNDIFKSLDYWIGSIHFLGQYKNKEYWTVDYDLKELKRGIQETFGDNIKKAVIQYYKYMEDMVENYKPSILGHLDLIKKNNRNSILFDESELWYRNSISSLLDKVKKSNVVVELNTGGKYRDYTINYYPSNWILKEINSRDIPITISRDSHDIESLDFEYEDSIKLLKTIGFSEIYYYDGKTWEKTYI